MAVQDRLPLAAVYSFLLLVWLTSRFAGLPAGEISAEFGNFLTLAGIVLALLPWGRMPPVYYILLIIGAVLVGTVTFQLTISGTAPALAIALLQALLIVILIFVPLIWSRISFIIAFLMFTGASLVDAHGNMLLWRGALLWLLGGMTSMLLTLSFSARFIAPPLNQDKNSTSYLTFQLLLQNLFGDLYRKRIRRAVHAEGIAPSFRRIKAGDIATHEAYSVYQGPRYLTAIGPGYCMLYGNWAIREKFDVRPQQRLGSLKATTRDGILVETIVIAGFSIQRPENPPEPRLPYPYERGAVKALKYSETVQQGRSEQLIHPFDQVVPRAIELVSEEISRRTLDELLDVDSDNEQTSPLSAVAGVVAERLNEFFGNRGLAVRYIIIPPFDLPEAVIDSRLSAWKRTWVTPISERRMGSSVRKLTEESAKAQLSVVQDLLDNLKTYKQAGDDQLRDDMPGYDDMLEQVERVIRDATTEGLLRSLLPENKDG